MDERARVHSHEWRYHQERPKGKQDAIGKEAPIVEPVDPEDQNPTIRKITPGNYIIKTRLASWLAKATLCQKLKRKHLSNILVVDVECRAENSRVKQPPRIEGKIREVHGDLLKQIQPTKHDNQYISQVLHTDS